MIPGVFYHVKASIWEPGSSNSLSHSTIEWTNAEGLFEREPFSLSALKATNDTCSDNVTTNDTYSRPGRTEMVKPCSPPNMQHYWEGED